jgi:hypothetical protein
MRILAILSPFLLLVPFGLASTAAGQVTLSSSTFQTGSTANTPTCSDPGTGGPSISMGTASCGGPIGYTSASSASADFTATATGGLLAASTQAAAAAPGGSPVQSSLSTASATSSGSWSVMASVHYSVAATGDQNATIQGNGGVDLAPSGILPASESLTVSLNPNVFAQARDNGPLTAASASTGEAEVTFAPVAANDLIMGTILAGGSPMAGLLVEALVSGSPIAATQTASDGSYLLSGIGVPVTLRLSDPGGAFATEFSPLLTPPVTYNADLAPVPAVPGLTRVGLMVLLCGLVSLGSLVWKPSFADQSR